MKYLIVILSVFFAVSCSTLETRQSNTDAANMELLKVNTKSKDVAYLSGEKALMEGNFKSAYDAFSESKVDDAVFYKALSAMNMGETTEAVSLFIKSADAQIKEAESYFNLGLIYYSMDERDISINFMSKTLKIEPLHEGANYFMGSVKYKDGIYKQAEQFYKNVLKSNPKSPDAVSALFYTLVNEEKNEEAWNLRNVMPSGDKELILNLLNLGNKLAHYDDVLSIIEKNKLNDKEFSKEKLKAFFALEKFGDAEKIIVSGILKDESKPVPIYVKKYSEMTFMVYLDKGALKAGIKSVSEFKEADIVCTATSVKELSTGKEFASLEELAAAMLKI